MTSDSVWNPENVKTQVSLLGVKKIDENFIRTEALPYEPQLGIDSSLSDVVLSSVSSSLSELNMSRRLISSVNIGMSKYSHRRSRISPEELSKKMDYKYRTSKIYSTNNNSR